MTATIVGKRAYLPRGFDLTGNRADARLFSGRAIDLDGTGDFISMGHPSDLDGFFNTGGTISMWVNMTSTATFDRLFDFSTGTYIYLQASFNGYIFNKDFTTTDGYWVYNGNGGVSLGEWFHFCLSYDASSTSNNPDLYINGVLQTIDGTTTPVGSAAAETSEKKIGSDASGTSNLDASLAHIKFITSTVTAAQALEMCNNPEQILPTGIATSALKSWLPCSDFAISPSDNSLNGMFAQDASGNGNHGALTNCGMVLAQPAPCPQLGLQSSSSLCVLNGSDTKLTVPQATAINQIYHSAPGGSIAFWCFANNMGEGSSGRLQGNNNSPRILIDNQSGDNAKLSFFFSRDSSTATYKTSSAVFPLKQWNHVVFTYDGSDAANDPICYLNGSSTALTKSGTNSGTLAADSSDKIFGASTSNREWDGFIASVAMWKGAFLDADAVSAIYAGGIGFDLTSDSGNYDNSSALAGAWVLDNPVTIQDQTSNNNDGTMSGTVNMATVPERPTADLSVFGKLTTTRLGSNVLALPPVGSTTDALGGYAKISDQPAFGTQNFTIAIWAKCESFIATYPYIFNFAAGSNQFGVRCFVVNSSGVLQFNYEGDTTSQTGSGTVSGLFGKWTFIVFQRLGAASFTMKARLIDAASYAFTTNKTVDVGDMTESGPSYLGNFDGTSNSSNGAIACPRVYLHGSSSAFSEAELNAIFEQGKRFLIGDS